MLEPERTEPRSGAEERDEEDRLTAVRPEPLDCEPELELEAEELELEPRVDPARP